MKPEYAECLPALRAAARECGYALAVHGSGERDLDLIAVPWAEEAVPATDLVEALRLEIDGFVIYDYGTQPGDYTRRNPMPKPHGRLAWAIHMHEPTGTLYIDLSVMPLLPTPEDQP